MRYQICRVPVDDISDVEILNLLKYWLSHVEQKFVTTPNPEMILLVQNNEVFQAVLNKSDLSLPDGVGLQFAALALNGSPIHHRRTGVDFVEQVCSLAEQANKRVLFFGGDPHSAEKAANKMKTKFSNLHIEAFDPGIIPILENKIDIQPSVINEINKRNPDVLFVGLSQVKQELFIDQIRSHVPSVKIAAGIGGAFEMIAGIKPRAPKWMQEMGVEWIWRLLIEPKRFARIFHAVFLFPAMIISCTLKQHRFWQATWLVLKELLKKRK